jgi:hypothetical protein
MTVEELKSVFLRWKAEDLSLAGIEFQERDSPPFNPHDDYRVVYEASFEPSVLDRAMIEFWITSASHVAVGIERYDRIAKRAGFKAIRRGFAVGHEPSAVSAQGLQNLFDAVSGGRIFIAMRSVLGFAPSTKLFMLESDRNRIAETGDQVDWISAIPDDGANSFAQLPNVLTYRPW